MTIEDPGSRSRAKTTAVGLNIAVCLCIFVGSPAVAVAQDLLTWPYRLFGIGFVARVLWTTILIVWVPLVLSVIAAKGRGFERRVFIVLWLMVAGYVIYQSIRTGRQY